MIRAYFVSNKILNKSLFQSHVFMPTATISYGFVECVSKIKHILSVIHCTICGAVCFQFTHFLCDDWENIYTLSYYHHQIGSMNYYPLLRVRSWNNGMRCMSFYILMEGFLTRLVVTRAFAFSYERLTISTVWHNNYCYLMRRTYWLIRVI